MLRSIKWMLTKILSFYPFIFYEKKTYKYNKKYGVKEKIRPICYASHMDRCIYQYYSKILNEIYNERTLEEGIDDCAIAYRDNKNKSNKLRQLSY